MGTNDDDDTRRPLRPTNGRPLCATDDLRFKWDSRWLWKMGGTVIAPLAAAATTPTAARSPIATNGTDHSHPLLAALVLTVSASAPVALWAVLANLATTAWGAPASAGDDGRITLALVLMLAVALGAADWEDPPRAVVVEVAREIRGSAASPLARPLTSALALKFLFFSRICRMRFLAARRLASTSGSAGASSDTAPLTVLTWVGGGTDIVARA